MKWNWVTFIARSELPVSYAVENTHRDGTCSTRTGSMCTETHSSAVKSTHRDGTCSTRTGYMCTETHSSAVENTHRDGTCSTRTGYMCTETHSSAVKSTQCESVHNRLTASPHSMLPAGSICG